MKHKKKKYIPKGINEIINYYVRKKLKNEQVSNYDRELANLIDYWKMRVTTFHYFVLIGYRNNTPIYYSITTGLTNSFYDKHDDDAEMMNIVYLYVIEHGNFVFINPNKITNLEDAYLAYEESYNLKDNHELMTKSLKRILEK